MAERMTMAQANTMQARIGLGDTLEGFLQRHPDFPEADVRKRWAVWADWFKANPAPPGVAYTMPAD